MALDQVPSPRAPQADDFRVVRLSEILAIAAPDGDGNGVRAAAEAMDAMLRGTVPVPGWERTLFVGWQETAEGVRLAKRAIRLALYQHHLPPAAGAFAAAYAYVIGAY